MNFTVKIPKNVKISYEILLSLSFIRENCCRVVLDNRGRYRRCCACCRREAQGTMRWYNRCGISEMMRLGVT